ncbi:MAG TPA: choice-of-anchor Q domain-containing protein [Flavisolibacter sp.]|nr:choice-of-anchor Q domain-containing protein [Flavisolibacter sp.]
MKTVLTRLVLPCLLLLLFLSCKRDSFTDNPDVFLRMGIDTLRFDTVFTSMGSVTQSFKIFNSASQGIRISVVRLAGGSASPFRINVAGTTGPQVTDVEIAANDSTYVFATVSINPSALNLPFIIRDSIEIAYNGKKQFVQLEAYGQNARFFRNRKITGTETWNNDLPYVLLGRLTIDTNAVLTINKGCRIYVHADAPVVIHGTLQVNGEKWDSTKVVFTGDRLDDPYRDYPASYPGLLFTDASKNNVINYAVIKNAYQGLAVINPSVNATPKVTINETIVDNAFDAGLLGINTNITARNVLVTNCGKNIMLVGGGNYSFTHCTVASFGNQFIQHKDPVLFVSNVLNNTTPAANLSALFRNCIFWGESNGLVESEVAVAKAGNTVFDVKFDAVLWRVKNNPVNAVVTGTIINDQAPQFDSINTTRNIYNFRLKTGSPAINKGVASGILIDLDGAPRPVGLPDLGAYEKQ